MGVVFCVVILLVGCGGKAPMSPTIQTEPEVQITQTPLDNFHEYWVRPADEMTMVFIPGGTFQMGSTQAEIEEAIELCQEHYYICNRWYYERESPIHSVSQDSYWIDQTEVSNAQYRLCVDAGECAEPLTCQKGEPTFDDLNQTNHPVVCVNWADAQNYCHWVGARLPSEAEWEYAYRGEQRLIFTWGNEFDGSNLNYCDENCSQTHTDARFDDGFAQTAPVGSYPSGMSWSGVYNLSGNVSEWVSDWFGEYTAEDVANPSGPSTGDKKMLKGCSWFYHPTYCRGAARPAVNPDTRFDYLGFRCVTSVVDNE
jgi:formylglycine-generating enzyme required for sulfatase activity